MGLHLGRLTPRTAETVKGAPVIPQPSASRHLPDHYIRPEAASALTLATWNISAVNNNPFEYWLFYEDQNYLDLMMGVESFLEKPGYLDMPVSSVFTEDMFQELKVLMQKENIAGLDELESNCRGLELRLMDRAIISEFVQDKSLGSKRLISMPDRITNTINIVTRKEGAYQPPAVCRPSVMNNFEGDLSSTEVWWEQWKRFMFEDRLTVRTKSGIAVMRPVEMIEPLMRSKYPAITEAEEHISIPLQILCLAIFDAIIVHLLNVLSPENSWQVVKGEICECLYRNKHKQQVNILAAKYTEVDILCLQEVAAVFGDAFKRSVLNTTHELILPEDTDGKRDQNSAIALRREHFIMETVREVTPSIIGYMPEGQKLADGGLLAIEVLGACSGDSNGLTRRQYYLVVSFHGDSNGLTTLPFLSALDSASRKLFPNHQLVFGIDANTYEVGTGDKQDFVRCIQAMSAMDLGTCWGEDPAPSACRTTCCSRTSLQPQLNKAIRYADRIEKSGRDPKDLIGFRKSQMKLMDAASMGPDRLPNPLKDNTGKLEYMEDTVFPTLEFPSDHAIIAVALQPV